MRILYGGREITGKGPGWEQLHKPVIKDLGRSPGNLLPASMYTQTDSLRIPDWGKGISGKTPGYIREKYSRLRRVWSCSDIPADSQERYFDFCYNVELSAGVG